MRLDITTKAGEVKYYGLVAKLCCHPSIYLDGIKQSLCVMADDDEGVIKRYEFGDDGQIIQSKPGHGKLFERRGRVEIVFSIEVN